MAGSAASAVVLGGSGLWLLFAPVNEEPEWSSLDQDKNFKTTYAGKYGGLYGRFLVGMGEEKGKTRSNGDWWQWSFRNRYSKEEDRSWFGGDDRGDLVDANALRGKCDEAYRSDAAKIKSGNSNLSSGEFKEDRLWKFCSSNGLRPQSAETEKGDHKLFANGKSSVVAGALLSLEHPDNEGIWRWLDKLAKSEKIKTGFFFDTSKGGNIRERCRSAYGLENIAGEGSGAEPKLDDLYRWCSIGGSR